MGLGEPLCTRPSIQRKTEQTRGSGTGAHDTVAVGDPSRVGSGSGTDKPVSARSAVSQLSSDAIAAAELTPRPCLLGRWTRSRKRSRRFAGVGDRASTLPLGTWCSRRA